MDAGGLRLTQGPNGKLYYAGESGGGNQGQVGFLHGDRAGVNRPFTNTPAGSGFSGSGQTITKKGGFLGSLGGAIGKVLDNPLVQLGVSAFGGAPLVGAYNLGKVGGGLATGQLSFGDALKGVATAAAAQGIGSLSGGFSNAVKDAVGGSLGNIAGGAAQGAIQGGAGSLLSGGDLGQGLLSGGLFGAGTTAGGEIAGYVTSEETKKKISAAGKGQKRSPEHIAKLVEARRKIPMTEEHKQRLREIHKNRVITDEYRQKLSAAQKGRKMKPESIEKTAAFHRGRKRSEETRQRMREGIAKAKLAKQKPQLELF